MDEHEARALLGVTEGDAWLLVRASYRRLIRDAHPDVSATPPRRAAELNEAYAVLRRAERAGPAPAASPSPSPAPSPRDAPPATGVRLVGSDTLLMAAPPDEAMLLLLGAGHHVGEIGYVDRSSTVFEVVLRQRGEACSLLVTLEPYGAGTEVSLALESLERAASLSPVRQQRALARALR